MTEIQPFYFSDEFKIDSRLRQTSGLDARRSDSRISTPDSEDFFSNRQDKIIVTQCSSLVANGRKRFAWDN